MGRHVQKILRRRDEQTLEVVFGVYIHIPFCIRRCPFCDFTLVTDAPKKLIDSYVQSLCTEIERGKSSTPLTSIYFGGGTPSILSAEHLGTIFGTLEKNFTFEPNIEITLETNPEDISSERAASWKRIGINRISLGVQSMDNTELKRLGRNHLEQDVINAFKILRDASFTNISVDLMFGLENQTLVNWEETLQKIFAHKPQHISTYNLTIEKNTSYDKEVSAGTLKVPSDDVQSNMLLKTKQLLTEHGYDPYEISNAALPGFESRHNMLYWTGKPYLGFGVSAHSFQNKNKTYRRFWNTKNIPTYIRNIENQKSTIDNEETLDIQTHLMERLMTGLRLKKGIDLALLKMEGLIPSEKMEKHMTFLVDEGMLHCDRSVLTIPQDKIPITDEILVHLFSD